MGFFSDIVDFALDPFDLVNTGGDASPGGVLDQIIDPTKSEREGALRQQEAAGNEAIRLQREAFDQIRQDLTPFRQVGGGALLGFHDALGRISGDPALLETQVPGIPDPNRADITPLTAAELTSDPFFQELAADQEQRLLQQRAAIGMAGSGGTRSDLNRNLLLLGNQFRQQDLANQMAERSAQNQFFQQDLENQFRQFGFQRDIDQQNIANRLGQQGQLFNQLLSLSNLGQSSAALTGSAAQSTAGNIGNYLTQIGNAQAAANMAAGQAQSAFTGQLLGAGVGAGAGALGLLPGDAGAVAGALLGFLSDRRSKENIQEVCTDDDGLKVYSFNYIGDDRLYIGKMAQEIIDVDPENCVMNDDGYYLVSAKYAPTEVA